MSYDLSLPSPAKINRFLHVCGRRADGYHNLQTLFQFLDYSDQLHFTRRQDNEITLSPALAGVPLEQNLIYRAALALKPFAKQACGIDIVLEKNLPMGGGIGGCSSNAATTLLALNLLWQCHLDETELQQLGRRLGADVPIFIHGHTAWAEGIGDELTDLDIDEPWFVVLVPAVHVSTAEIFSHQELTRDSEAITVRAFFEQGGKNDCEPLVKKLYPEVAKARSWLNNVAPARMTGTGACVFAAVNSKAQADDIISQLPATLSGFVAKGVNISPLHTALQQISH